MSVNNPISKSIKGALIVPGLPHLLKPELNPGYKKLTDALAAAGDHFAADGVKRVIYYSTQWISVLGHSFQARAELKGHHVDENWYELPDLPFQFKVDTALAARCANAIEAKGWQAKLIDYDNFPVDTGTIVADSLLNKGRFTTGMVSCCVYSDFADTTKLAATLKDAIEQDGVPTAVVCVSMLSGRFFTRDIDLREDHVSDPEDDKWNKRILALMEKGEFAEVEALLGDYAKSCKVDMGFKVLSFLKGIGALAQGRKAAVKAYGALYGTGAAVVAL